MSLSSAAPSSDWIYIDATNIDLKGSMSTGGNIDMNSYDINAANTVNSNNVKASNSMVLPTGTDAY
jgi:hypothetical protein